MHVSLGQNSLQGALDGGSSNSEQDMQRYLGEFNRTVTIIFWYKAETEPIRLQYMIPTFPYFQLMRVSSITTDLGLTTDTLLDTFDPRLGKWEQHTISTTRYVDTQQRLLYRMRRNLLEGLNERECLGLGEELQLQPSRPIGPPQTVSPKSDWPNSKGPLKRPASDSSSQESHTSKVHVPNGYYLAPAGTSSTSPSSTPQAPVLTSEASPTPKPPTPIPTPSSKSSPYVYPSPAIYTPVPNTGPSSPKSPTNPTNPQATSSIPYHPHPPLKRWPNDYTVSEVTQGFAAMDKLIAQAPNGTNMTQRLAFERIFGSRYVKSTVCRHRGVWKRAKGPLMEQFEAMGTDERACWGEFIRRVEGRPPSKSSNSNSSAQGSPLPTTSIMMFHGYSGSAGQSQMTVMHNNPNGIPSIQNQTISPVAEKEKKSVEEPVMGSLQKPDSEDASALPNDLNVYNTPLASN